jgi:CheY-like chemotaxis protein
MNDKKKILVVDDDEGLRTVLVDKLNISGFEAVFAADGEEGLEKALKWHPDAILLDVIMPKMDGFEMLGKLRDDEWGKRAKVIMLTVLENADSVAKAVEGTAQGYLIKTQHSLDDVVAYVKEVLNKK